MRKFYPSKKQIYWVLHITGWSGMAISAILNNVILLNASSDIQVQKQFTGTLIAIIASHTYKVLVLKPAIFNLPTYKIVLHAIIAILVISSTMALFSYLVLSLNFFDAPKYLTLSGFIMQVLNLGIFVAPWVIIYFIFKIFEKNKRIMQQKLELQILTQVTELELLKTQLNPHFLFNALNSVKALIQFNNRLAAEALSKLGELLQFSLSYQKRPAISIKEEIAEVDKYLTIEKIRFGERLHYEFDIAQETFEAKIPPAIILTLAENAIKHGIAQLENGGSIRIECTCQDHWITIKVRNSGELKSKKTNGIGLINIQKRLENLFGSSFNFKITQLKKGLVEASIHYSHQLVLGLSTTVEENMSTDRSLGKYEY